MKKPLSNLQSAKRVFVVSVFLLLWVQLASAQTADTLASHPTTPMYDRYMQRYKTCKTVAWVLVSSGIALEIIGMAEIASSNSLFSPGIDTGASLMLVGIAMAIPSIPLFIVARSSKKKAMMLQLQTATVPGPGKFNYAAVSLKLNL